jgi:hypothetical protein
VEQLPLQVDILIKKASDILKMALVPKNSNRTGDEDQGQPVGEATVPIEMIVTRD